MRTETGREPLDIYRDGLPKVQVLFFDPSFMTSQPSDAGILGLLIFFLGLFLSFGQEIEGRRNGEKVKRRKGALKAGLAESTHARGGLWGEWMAHDMSL